MPVVLNRCAESLVQYCWPASNIVAWLKLHAVMTWHRRLQNDLVKYLYYSLPARFLQLTVNLLTFRLGLKTVQHPVQQPGDGEGLGHSLNAVFGRVC